MNQVIQLKRDIIIRVIISFFVIALIALFVTDEPKRFIYSLFFGTGIGVLNFLELASTMQKVAVMSPSKAQMTATTRYFLRFTVVGIVLFISIKAPYLSIVGTATGLLLVKLVILLGNFIEKHVLARWKKNHN